MIVGYGRVSTDGQTLDRMLRYGQPVVRRCLPRK